MNYELIDNFLEPKDLKTIQDLFLGNKIAWNCLDGAVSPNDGNYQFVHVLYTQYSPCSPFFDALGPIWQKLQPCSIVRSKANLNMKTIEHVESEYHTDVDNCITAIYYVNTNNGYTEFESNGMKVNSVENRLIIFDSNEKHRAVTTTDTSRRVVINFNYFI
tara:strand:- start:10 stop:492 length:483 start_codon:yes stop_codon:yes gene_type:complete